MRDFVWRNNVHAVNFQLEAHPIHNPIGCLTYFVFLWGKSHIRRNNHTCDPINFHHEASTSCQPKHYARATNLCLGSYPQFMQSTFRSTQVPSTNNTPAACNQQRGWGKSAFKQLRTLNQICKLKQANLKYRQKWVNQLVTLRQVLRAYREETRGHSTQLPPWPSMQPMETT